jgi:hypothetical protein
MLDFAEFDGKMFLVYYKNSNDSRTPVDVLLLSFRGIFFASIERIGIFYGSTAYSDAVVAWASRSRSAYSAFFFVEVKSWAWKFAIWFWKSPISASLNLAVCVKYRSIYSSRAITSCLMPFLGSKLSNTRFPKFRAFVSCVMGIRRPSCSRAKTRIGNRVEGRLLAICLP